MYVKYVARLHGSQIAEVLTQRKRGGELTTGQKDLARTLIDILGEEQVIELVNKDKLAEQLGLERLIEMVQHLEPVVGGLAAEQRVELLRALMPELSEKELKNLLATSDDKSAGKNDQRKVPSHDKKD